MQASASNQFRLKSWKSIALTPHPLANLLLAGGAIATSLALLLDGSPFSALAALVSVGFVYPRHLLGLYHICGRFCIRRGLNPYLILGVLFGLFAASGLFLGMVDPAHAQFFKSTETWLKANTEVPDDMIALVLNMLRFIFILYVGIAIVQVIAKGQQGEDWQTLARTPLIVVMSVTLGDQLAKQITG